MTRILALWIAITSVALVACSAPQAPPPAGGGSETPKFGGTFNMYGDDFTDWDMAIGGKTTENMKSHQLVYDNLVGFKRGPEVEYVSQVLAPELAERWEVSADARTFTYYLRKGAKFANIPPVNGREFTAADVKWTLEYYTRTGEFKDKKLPPSQNDSLFEGLAGIDTPDKYTVRVKFLEPFVPFLNYSASQWMPIVPPETYKADATPPRLNALIGTGPYIYDLANSQKDVRFVFTKNPNYWDAPKPYLDSIRRLVIPDQGTRAAAFKVKQIDVLAENDFGAAQEIKNGNPEAVMYEALSPWQSRLAVSEGPNSSPALKDVRVRRAIYLAIDRDEINKVQSGGLGAWALAGAWPGLFTDAETHKLLKTDIAEAKRLLAEAGYPNGLTLYQLSLSTSSVASLSDQLLQAQLKRAGINTNLMVMTRVESRAKLYVGDYDIVSTGSSVADADFDTVQFGYHSSSPQNWSVTKDAELDKLVVAQRRETNPEKRREIQRAVVQRIYDMAYNPPTIFTTTREFWHSYVKNYRPHFSLGEYNAFAWLDK